MTDIAYIIGTRPEFVRASVLIKRLLGHPQFNVQLINTGQHYDYNMSKIFLEQLKIPKSINLNVGSDTHARQTGRIMAKIEDELVRLKPDLVMLEGDTNSTLAGALASVKLQIPIGHLDAGARCFGMRMKIPEEINRVIVDCCSSFLFAGCREHTRNLRNEHQHGNIFLVGDSLYEVLMVNLPKVKKVATLKKMGIDSKYNLVTIHRAEITSNPKFLRNVLKGFVETGENFIFPVHPRTLKVLRKVKFKKSNQIWFIEPVGYFDMINLMRHAEKVITDSSSVTREAFYLRVPTIVLRNRYEWNAIVRTNDVVLVGMNRKRLVKEIAKKRTVLNHNPFYFGSPPSSIILETLTKIFK